MSRGEIARNELHAHARFQILQVVTRRAHAFRVTGLAASHAQEAELGDRASGEDRTSPSVFGNELRDPLENPLVMHMNAVAHCEQYIHIQKKDHGKSSSSRRTISDVNGGVPGRERRTFSPLMGQT
jgi:hypothetical protein